MKNNIITIATYSLLISGLVAGNWFDHSEVLMLAIWGTWLIVIFSLIGVLLPPEEFYKNPDTRKKVTWQRVFYFTHLLLLISAGWIFTATTYFAAWICLWLKREAWDSEQQKADAKEA